MKISELINKLARQQKLCGDCEVVAYDSEYRRSNLEHIDFMSPEVNGYDPDLDAPYRHVRIILS
jgi:hypothetical protein